MCVPTNIIFCFHNAKNIIWHQCLLFACHLMLSICLPPKRWLPKITKQNHEILQSLNQGSDKRDAQFGRLYRLFLGNKDFCPLQTHFPQLFGCCSATSLQTINCELPANLCCLLHPLAIPKLFIVNCQLSIAIEVSLSVFICGFNQCFCFV